MADMMRSSQPTHRFPTNCAMGGVLQSEISHSAEPETDPGPKWSPLYFPPSRPSGAAKKAFTLSPTGRLQVPKRGRRCEHLPANWGRCKSSCVQNDPWSGLAQRISPRIRCCEKRAPGSGRGGRIIDWPIGPVNDYAEEISTGTWVGPKAARAAHPPSTEAMVDRARAAGFGNTRLTRTAPRSNVAFDSDELATRLDFEILRHSMPAWTICGRILEEFTEAECRR